MFRYLTRISGHVLLLAGLVFSGYCSASSTTYLEPEDGLHALLPLQTDLLFFQHDLYNYRSGSSGMRLANTHDSFDTGFAIRNNFYLNDTWRPLEPQPGHLFVGINSGSASITTEAAGLAVPSPSTPVPMALWILGTGMIGLSAVGRRRAPEDPLPMPA